jgi:hypothetical protein
MPPHTVHSGTTNASMSATSTSPSGARRTLSGSSSQGFAAERRAGSRRVVDLHGREAGGDHVAGERLAAGEADDPVDGAVQVDHATGARPLVQGVDVLRHDAVRDAGRLELGQGPVALVGRRRAERPPAEVAAGPVALAVALARQELLEGHRVAHRGALAPVVGDAGVGAHAGAGQHGDRAPAEEGDRLVEGGRVE